ncbi:uncharacterized protein LOC130371698 [Gadus chalcogrammus]|uniref:uncharacterized protein LOC130371698 n=1 Tax=Gadus chalcogrammus TaxID=1042646 RepID=UPI0024C4909C|nr:uncharacterized protein LOC130371698 [Gadus chalcogrammus]
MRTDPCPLTHKENRSFCLFKNPDETFGGTPFKIYLCHEPCPTAACCEVLEENYYPQINITPIAPSQLTVVLNSSRFIFSWLSSYEVYLPNFFLQDYLQYQLRLQREDQHQAPVTLSGMGRSLAVDVESLAAGGQYTARVRSSPAEGTDYRGKWSPWSQESRWRTPGGPPRGPPHRGGGRDVGLVIAVCLLTPVLLLASVTLLRMRKRTFIPTPVLRFSPLTEHRQSLAVPLPPDTAPMEAECAALISVLRAPVDVPVDARAGAPGPDGKGALESGPEEDSGCCHCSPRSEDGGGYRNAYCTLSDPPEPPDPPHTQGDGERGGGGYRNAYCTLSDPQDPPGPPRAPEWPPLRGPRLRPPSEAPV